MTTMIYKVLHRKRQIDQHKRHSKSGINSDPERVSSSCSTSGNETKVKNMWTL